MRTLTPGVLGRVLVSLSIILCVGVAGDVQNATGQDPLTLEGEWLVTSSWDRTNIGGKFTIVRQGEGYRVRFAPRTGPNPGCEGCGLFYGSPTQMMATDTPTYNDLVYAFLGSTRPTSVQRRTLAELEGKVAPRHRITLAADGRSADYVEDGIDLNYETETGRLTSYNVVPFQHHSTLERVPGTAGGPKLSTTSDSAAVAQVEARGDFYFLTKDGRKLTDRAASTVPLEDGTKVVTGTDGHVRMVLPDNTTFTVGPNSDFVIDKFVYDPANTPTTLRAQLNLGIFRFVTGKVARKDPAQMRVTLPVGTIGIRGTDFEATVDPGGSGRVVLYFGQLEITERKSGFTFILEAGQMVTFAADGSISRPMAAK